MKKLLGLIMAGLLGARRQNSIAATFLALNRPLHHRYDWQQAA